MNPKMMMGDLLDAYPDAEDVLLDYGVHLDNVDMERSLGKLCKAEGLDVHEIIAEIAALTEGELDDDWDNELEGANWMPSNNRRAVWN